MERELTTPGFAVGTVSFMSPEQARGEEVDARADLFAFGSVLYYMAVGEPPFRGSTPAVILSGVLDRDPVPPLERNPGLPAKLQEIILKALEKNRDYRYQSARDMVVDLRRLVRELDSQVATGATASPGSSAATALAGLVGGHLERAVRRGPRCAGRRPPEIRPRRRGRGRGGHRRRPAARAALGGAPAARPDGCPSRDPLSRRAAARQPLAGP